MSARGSQVAVTWFTKGSQDKPEVRLAISTDAGVNFATPMTVDDAEPIGRPDITHLADGSLVVVWLGRVGDAGQLRARRFGVDGSAGEPITVGPMQPSRRSGFPQVAAIAGGAVVAWTDPLSGLRLALMTPR